MAQLVLKTVVGVAASVAAITTAQTPTPAFDATGAEAGVIAPMAEAIPAPISLTAETPEGGFQPLSAIPMTQHDALPLDGVYPAVTESTGTWLRRGLWYADLDAVVMARTWDSAGASLIEEYDAVISQVILQVGVQQFVNVVNIQQQAIGESSPGYDGSARLALGRFLFRDQKNRDHTFEFVTFGGAEWDESLAAEAQLTGPLEGIIPGIRPGGTDQRGLHVPLAIDGTGPLQQDDISGFLSLDRANTMAVEYASRFHSWEWNYSVAQRMRHDRMELQPDGQWVRRANSGITWDYTAGFRYFDVDENLNWFATDIASVDLVDGDTDGSYLIRASNNLFGLQLGLGMTYETDRWNISVSTKHGMYINDARATTALTYVDPDEDTAAAVALNNHTTDLHENGVSYLATGAVQARYHLRPNLSLRAGWEFMFVTGLALAPNRADFNPAQAQLHMTGDAFYHGVSFGTEYYW